MKRVLLADDSVAARKSIETMLEMAGIEVVAVGNGDLALSRLAEFDPHMVIVDALMPGRSGYEVCAEIKRDPSRAKLPVLIATTEFEPFDQAAAAAASADGHLVKPLDAGAIETMRRVWELYEGEPAEEERPAQTGDLAEVEPIAAPFVAPKAPSTLGPDAFITNTMRAPDIPDELAEAYSSVTEPLGKLEPTAAEMPVAWVDAEPVRTIPVSELRTYESACPACGESTASGDIFCLGCGAMVLVTPEEAERLANTIFCPGCRQEMLPGEVICVSCGAVV